MKNLRTKIGKFETIQAEDQSGLHLQDDGGNGIFIKDGGDVGIGTTNPGSYKLNVNGSVRLGNLTSSLLTHEIRTGGGVTGNKLNGLGFIPGTAQLTDQYLSFYTGNSVHIGSIGSVGDTLLIRTRDTGNALKILQNGNVGIGTTIPDFNLSVVSNTDPAKIGIHGYGGFGDGTVAAQLLFVGKDSNDGNRNLAQIQVREHSHALGTGSMEFVTRISGTEVARMIISDIGNVGIGTTSPTSRLSIHTSGATAKGLQVRTDDAAADSIRTVGGGGDDDVKFVLKGSGNVGIGTTNPGQFSGLFSNRSALSVGGQFPAQIELGFDATAYSGNVTGTGALMFMNYSNTATGMTVNSQFVAGISGLTVSAESTTNPAQNAGGALRFWVKPVNGIPDEKMRLTEDGNLAIYNLTASADVQTDHLKTLTTSSDKRLKNDLGDCEYGLTEVLQVQPKKYTWKEGPEDQKPTVGFFAQDVHAIMPEAAPKESVYDQDSNPVLDENGEQDYRWGLNSQTIIAALVNATKEQQQIIEDLKSRIETLEQ